MPIDYKIGTPCALSSLKYGEIFSHDGELYMRVNFKDSCASNWAVALRNGNIIPFTSDPIVVWEDCEIKRRRRRVIK